jgi:hypothetical protein
MAGGERPVFRNDPDLGGSVKDEGAGGDLDALPGGACPAAVGAGETHGPSSEHTRPGREHDGLFVAIFVEDIEEARRDCLAGDAEVLGEMIWADKEFGDPAYSGVAGFFVRAPDGTIYVFQQGRD